jgi:hypothetical protein
VRMHIGRGLTEPADEWIGFRAIVQGAWGPRPWTRPFGGGESRQVTPFGRSLLLCAAAPLLFDAQLIQTITQ